MGFEPKDRKESNGRPNDLKGEGKPNIFRVKTDCHENAGKKIEKLIKEAFFDDVSREEDVGKENENHANPADDVIYHKRIVP
ncbi:hypothetical protein IKQ19_05345 [Candidatus Saccharibacteria bacterium]|nr:hypothetical protein [Candidatus Saccharibacteria bacterium]